MVPLSESFHYHKCGKCDHVWCHDPESEVFGNNREEHTCAICGQEQYIKDYTAQARPNGDTAFATYVRRYCEKRNTARR